jgi:uncharacterized protein (TIGR02246 family)
MRMRSAIITPLLAGACCGIGPRGAHAQLSQAPPPGASAPGAATKGSSERPEDTKAIHALAEAFTRAYNRGDAGAVAGLFTDDAEVTDESGATIRGREAVADLFAAALEDDPGGTIELTTESIRFLGPDVAEETGHARTVPAGGGSPETTRYTVLYVRRDGHWLHDSVHEHPDQLSPHDRLEELEWLVGEWIDESDEGVVYTTCRWSDDRNFLLRDFTLRVGGQPVMSGTQRIGWDPLTEQFKTWVFDADGGHSEGLWSRNGKDQWVIKATGVLVDGRAVSATQVLTFVNKGMARWQSVDRAIGGQAVPDVPEIILVRTPPKPAASSLPAPNTTRKP